jgi:hypothetical protein
MRSYPGFIRTSMLRLGILCVTIFSGCADKDALPQQEVLDTGLPDVGMADAEADLTLPGPDTSLACPFELTGIYEPFMATELHQFPDDVLSRDDPDSPTGRRLSPDPELFPWVNNAPTLVAETVADLNHLSGFSLIGKAYVRFANVIHSGWPMDEPNLEAVRLMKLGDDSDPVPVSVAWGHEGKSLFAQPLTPLEPGQQYALVVSNDITDTRADCAHAAPLIAGLLRGDSGDPRLSAHATAYQAAVERSGWTADNIVAATVWTTHRDHDVLFLVSDNIRARQYTWGDDAQCVEERAWLACTMSFTARDYRDDRAVLEARATESYVLPVRVWYPLGFEGPRPVLLYGHGLNSEFGEMALLVDRLIDLGFAIVAAPALYHADHPSRTDPEAVAALKFLGIDLTGFRIDGMTMRGNFNQTNFERLQLLQLLRQHPQLPGDDRLIIDPEHTSYFGISLGGILGSGLLAFDDRLRAAVLSVAGGQLMAFATDTENVEQFRPILVNIFGGEGPFERMLPVAQTLVDAADPAALAPAVILNRRVPRSQLPDILMPVAVYDNVVPPATGKALARALGIPHLQPVVEPVVGLLVQPTPAEGNHQGSGATHGFFQYDRLPTEGGSEPAGHNNTPASDLGIHQLRVFLSAVRDGNPGIIVNPYEVFDVPPLE